MYRRIMYIFAYDADPAAVVLNVPGATRKKLVILISSIRLAVQNMRRNVRSNFLAIQMAERIIKFRCSRFEWLPCLLSRTVYANPRSDLMTWWQWFMTSVAIFLLLYHIQNLVGSRARAEYNELAETRAFIHCKITYKARCPVQI